MRRSIAVVAMFTLFLASTRPAEAMSHLQLSPAEIAQNADLIVVGAVTGREVRWNDAHTMIFTDVRVHVSELVRATGAAKSAGSSEVILSFAGGAIGDTAARVSDQVELLPGRRYVLFTRDDGRTYANPLIGGAQGAFEVLRDEATGIDYVVTLGRRPVLTLDASAIRSGERAVRGFRAGSALPMRTPESNARVEAQSPVTDAEGDVAAPLAPGLEQESPMTLAELLRVVSADLVHSPLMELRFRRETTDEAKAPWFGDAPLREAIEAASDLQAPRLIDPRPEVALHTAPNAPESLVGPPSGAFSSNQAAGGAVGICGYQNLFLTMQQVPPTWWSYSENSTAMWTWNQFMDLFRMSASDGTYANNSQNEFCGWPTDADLYRVYGYHWNGALAATITWFGCECCRITQSDIAFNPAYAWTTSMSAALSSSAIPYMPAVIHELGHALGMQRGPFTESYDYDLPTVMHGYNPGVWEDGLGLHAVDAYLIRRQYNDQRSVLGTTDMGVETYSASNGLNSATLSTSTAIPSQSLTVSRITVENMSASPVSNVRLRLYLSPTRAITSSSIQMGSYWSWNSFAAEAYSAQNYSTSIPWNTPGGRYYVGARVTRNGDAGDDYSYNDVSWVPASIQVNNPQPSVTALAQRDLSVGRSNTITISGAGFVPGVTRVSAGADIPTSTTVTSATSLRATFSVPGTVAWGARSLSVSNPAPGGGTAYSTQPLRIGVFVYPGDADQNGVVDERDILPIGRYYGYRGAVRDGASTSWSSQALTSPWANLAASYADCDGNGVVNAVDVQAIVLNWRRTPGSSSATPAAIAEACEALLASLDPHSTDPAQREMRQAVLAMLPEGAQPQLAFSMEIAAPNPSRGAATLAFVLPTHQQEVRVSIFSAQGQLVWERVERDLAPARYQLTWDGRTRAGERAAPGLYLTRVTAGGQSASARLVRLP